MFGIPIIKKGMTMATSNEAYREELAKRLREARDRKKLGLRELARLAEVSPSYLSEIEDARNIPSVDKIQRIANALGISLSRLLPAA